MIRPWKRDFSFSLPRPILVPLTGAPNVCSVTAESLVWKRMGRLGAFLDCLAEPYECWKKTSYEGCFDWSCRTKRADGKDWDSKRFSGPSPASEKLIPGIIERDSSRFSRWEGHTYSYGIFWSLHFTAQIHLEFPCLASQNLLERWRQNCMSLWQSRERYFDWSLVFCLQSLLHRGHRQPC